MTGDYRALRHHPEMPVPCRPPGMMPPWDCVAMALHLQPSRIHFDLMPLRPSRAVRKPAQPPLAEDSLALALSIAGEIVAGVINGRSLNDGLAGVWRAYPELSASQRGAIMDLSYGCLRDYGRASLVLSRLLQQPLTETHTDGFAPRHAAPTRSEAGSSSYDGRSGGRSGGADRRRRASRASSTACCAMRCARRTVLELALKADSEASLRHPKWWIEADPQDLAARVGIHSRGEQPATRR